MFHVIKAINDGCPCIVDVIAIYFMAVLTTSLYSRMDLLPDTEICGLRMRRECRERFPRHRASRTCRDACCDR